MITDKLRSYGAARAKMGLRVEQSPAQRTEQSGREFSPADKTTGADHEALQVSPAGAWFLSVHDQVANLFHIPYPESATAAARRASCERGFAVWREISKTAATA
jgi:putative transposase